MTGDSNTAVGRAALANNDVAMLNTAVGEEALFSNTRGGSNTAVGGGTLMSNIDGEANAAIGTFALLNNTSGSYNAACGAYALFLNTTGMSNTGAGEAALGGNSTGSANTAVGADAVVSSFFNGNSNTAVGFRALGNESLMNGNQNIAIGSEAGSALTNGNKNIYLGHPGASIESKTMRLGSHQTATYIAGVNTAAVTGTAVLIDSNGRLGVTLSSARYKRDIEAMGTRSSGVLHLRPVTFAYTGDSQATRQYGLIAEEVASVFPELVARTADGQAQTIRYQELVPMLLNELQRLQREVTELTAEVRSNSRAGTGP